MPGAYVGAAGTVAGMVRRRVGRYGDRVREELRRTFAEEHTPREVAGSFALGTFVTMLPTLGFGLLFFVAVAFVFERVSKLALFASVAVFNPVVKWGVYVASYALGAVLLGPPDAGVARADVSLDAGSEILLRLLVGNVILAVVATVVAYVVVHRLAVAYRASHVADILGEAVDELVEEVVDP